MTTVVFLISKWYNFQDQRQQNNKQQGEFHVAQTVQAEYRSNLSSNNIIYQCLTETCSNAT